MLSGLSEKSRGAVHRQEVVNEGNRGEDENDVLNDRENLYTSSAAGALISLRRMGRKATSLSSSPYVRQDGSLPVGIFAERRIQRRLARKSIARIESCSPCVGVFTALEVCFFPDSDSRFASRRKECTICAMIRRALVAFLLLLPVISISSRACTCSQESPGKCPGLQKDDVVFLGTVTVVEDIAYATPRAADSSDVSAKEGAPVDIVAARLTRYHFRIDESFAAPDAPGSTAEIDVFSGGDDGDCGYRFQRGQQYVVFTHQGTDNRLFATICSGTRPVAAARALLPQLRAMRNGQRVASVFGVLRRSEPPFLALPDDPDEPLANVSLKLRSRDDRFETSSNSDGVYSFYDVHAGQYSFTARLPVRMELTRKSLTGGLPPFKIPNGACYEYDVDALPTGHMRGSVLGPGGKPLPLASVELYRAGTYDDSRPGLWGFKARRASSI